MIPPSLSPEHNKAITLHLGRIRDSVGLLFGLAMILFGVWLISAQTVDIDDRFSGGLAACFLGGIVVLSSIVEILIYRMEMNEDGFRVQHIHFYYSFQYRWSDVSRFSVTRVFFIPVVGFNVTRGWENDSDEASEGVARLRRGIFLSGYDHTLYMPFGLRHDELAEVLNEWRLFHKRERSYTCPCCGYYSFIEEPGSFDNCALCAWKDDELQLAFPHLEHGFNDVSLIVAQRNYELHGAAKKDLKKSVRKPGKDDERDQVWRPIRDDDMIPPHKDLKAVRALWRSTADDVEIYYWKSAYWFRYDEKPEVLEPEHPGEEPSGGGSSDTEH